MNKVKFTYDKFKTVKFGFTISYIRQISKWMRFPNHSMVVMWRRWEPLL